MIKKINFVANNLITKFLFPNITVQTNNLWPKQVSQARKMSIRFTWLSNLLVSIIKYSFNVKKSILS